MGLDLAYNARGMGILLAFRHSRQGGTAMSEPPYRALRIVLGFLSLLLALGGLLLIFSSRGLILRVFMHPPESEISTLLLAAVKEMGGIVLTLSVMLFLAARDPLHTGDHAARLSLHAGYPEALSGLSDLGAFLSSAGAGGRSLLFAAARDSVETGGAFLRKGRAEPRILLGFREPPAMNLRKAWPPSLN